MIFLNLLHIKKNNQTGRLPDEEEALEEDASLPTYEESNTYGDRPATISVSEDSFDSNTTLPGYPEEKESCLLPSSSKLPSYEDCCHSNSDIAVHYTINDSTDQKIVTSLEQLERGQSARRRQPILLNSVTCNPIELGCYTVAAGVIIGFLYFLKLIFYP